MIRRILWAVPVSAALVTILYLIWQPGHHTDTSFDKGSNGIWVGHQWYGGRDVKSGKTIDVVQIDSLVEVLRSNRVKYVFVHAGPILPDGSIAEMPQPPFYTVKAACAPGTVFLPWLGGHAGKLPMHDPHWRAAFIATLGELHSRGFNGVHLDIEPLRDMHPGYIELLKEIREQFADTFMISHATRRLSPFGVSPWPLSKWFWSSRFYSETMQQSDQTVLMGYDTMLRWRKPYVAYIAYETKALLKLASRFSRHKVQIGIPSYEDVPLLSDPEVENIPNAIAGVRAALERNQICPETFEGVSVYAHWVTDTSEWKDFAVYWLRRQ